MGSDLKDQEASTKDILRAIEVLKLELSQQSQQQFAQLSDKISDFQDRVLTVEKAVLEQKRMIDKLQRKNNIVIYGLSEIDGLYQGDLLEVIQRLFKDRLDINLERTEVNNIYRIGKNRQIIKLELLTFLKKVEVLKSSKKLKGTKIYISEDLSREEQENQKILRQQLKLAREKKYRAYIKGSSLIVNGDRYTAEQLQSICGPSFLVKSSSAPATPDRRERANSTGFLEAGEENHTNSGSLLDTDKEKLTEQGENTSQAKGESRVENISQEAEELSQRVLRSGPKDGQRVANITETRTHRTDSWDKRRPPVRNQTPKNHTSTGKIKGG